VQEITWRATKLLTKHGQFLIIPNSKMSSEAILNYSEPTVPTRLTIEVGVSYNTPPNEARAALLEALSYCPLVLRTPPPAVLLNNFGESSLIYHVWFWIGDYALELEARDQVRTHIWYTFRRRNIEIPYPIAVEIGREDKVPERPEREIVNAARLLGTIELFTPLDEEFRLSLARTAPILVFADGEPVVQQGQAGQSMYVVLSGRVRVVLEPSNQEVAIIEPGGFFGEMSMLTGDARTATVRAIDDVRVLEIQAEQFREIALEQPSIVEHMSTLIAARRIGLDEARATAANSSITTTAPRTLLGRIQKFLRLPGREPVNR
jgi:CRP-like cAMP-binding protein